MSDGILFLLAIVACVGSAVALYGASPNGRLRALRLGRWGMPMGVVLIVIGAVLWSVRLGIGTGLMAALATWMLGLILLPYLAWQLLPVSVHRDERSRSRR